MKHHELHATDPLHLVHRDAKPDNELAARDAELARVRAQRPLDFDDPVHLGRSVAQLARTTAIHAIALDQGVSETEAARILDEPRPSAPIRTPEQIAMAAREAADKRLAKWLAGSGIPVRPEMVATIIAGQCEHTAASAAAATWLKDPSRRILGLFGPPGIGKTVAAARVAVASTRRRQSVAYVREPMLVRLVHSPTQAHEAKLAALYEVDLLIVDELGTMLSGQGEKARDAVFALVDNRLASSGRTILIGNIRAEQLEPAYGSRCVDRLREVGVVVHLDGESMRGRS